MYEAAKAFGTRWRSRGNSTRGRGSDRGVYSIATTRPPGPLLQSKGWKSGFSKWGQRELIAHRAVCSRSVDDLPLLKRFEPASNAALNECIAALVNGPGPMQHLLHKAEAQLVQHFQPESLEY
ncbi:hypothetical protein G6O67_004253 [Ophiocordyceps sinensis]|uniref:Uncharacterized protein n=1 Tax=Ophiocordyceps sinensis TaxID=72228 RepID=A0A8H4PPF6_9HYPO|nr:hypothetical protein G6O67_004253 [Ophiocordyceps sinensis]